MLLLQSNKFMPSFLQEAILHTIIYSDIFDYPLTKDEIGKWLIGTNNIEHITKDKIEEIKLIKRKNGFYFLKGMDKLVSIRKERKKYSEEKLNKTCKIINRIKLIPSVKLIGITGALAMDNGKKEDDIDLFIITSSGLLWTTRLLVTLLVEMTGMRRHPQEKNVNNKICLNMFMDENNLEIPKKEQDLFSAHEVMQMKPLWDKDKTYQKFLYANKWVKKFLPNAVLSYNKEPALTRRGRQITKNNKANIFLDLVEVFCKRFQLWYMRKRRTAEVIKEGVIRFHPQDARTWIMDRYYRKINNYAKQ